MPEQVPQPPQMALPTAARIAELSTPTFSIITASFGAAHLLPALHASLVQQRCQDFEWIVMDGGSSDGTPRLLAQWAAGDLHGRLVWRSAPDGGIYDAMNQGVTLASGRYLLFLGADDVLADDGVLADALRALGQPPSAPPVAALLGDVEVVGKGISRPRTDWHLLVRNAIHHQGAFYARALFQDFRYDIRQRIGADYELNLLLHLRRSPCRVLPRLVARCGADGVSNQTDERRIYAELRHIRARHLGSLQSWLCWAVGMANVLRRRVGARLGGPARRSAASRQG